VTAAVTWWGTAATYDEILAQVLDLRPREGRLSYRAPKRRFELDNDDLADLKVEFIQVPHR